MSDDERHYIELEIMQELGMLEPGTNIMELQAEWDKEKKEEELYEMENEPEQELENHMVIGEYYEED